VHGLVEANVAIASVDRLQVFEDFRMKRTERGVDIRFGEPAPSFGRERPHVGADTCGIGPVAFRDRASRLPA
jgi:hypothetical protein